MPAPTFIGSVQTAWDQDGGGSRVTPSFDVLAGDTLVAVAMGENDASDVEALGVSGGSLTWTLKIEGIVADFGDLKAWEAVVDADKSMTATVTGPTRLFALFGMAVLTFRGATGTSAGLNPFEGMGQAQRDWTVLANSIAVVAVVDRDKTPHHPIDGVDRIWLDGSGPVVEHSYFYDASDYAIYIAHHEFAGALGTYTFGLAEPQPMRYTIGVIEVLGTIEPDPPSGASTMDFGT